jgi:hypothetical protein
MAQVQKNAQNYKQRKKALQDQYAKNMAYNHWLN